MCRGRDKRLKTSTRREAEGQIRHVRLDDRGTPGLRDAKARAFRVQTLHICILLSSVCRNIIFRPRSLRKRGAAPACRLVCVCAEHRAAYPRFLVLMLASSSASHFLPRRTATYLPTPPTASLILRPPLAQYFQLILLLLFKLQLSRDSDATKEKKQFVDVVGWLIIVRTDSW